MISKVSMGGVQQQLHDRLQTLTPSVLQVDNESSGHGGYFEGKESHFKVSIVSPVFEGLRAVQRHQKNLCASRRTARRQWWNHSRAGDSCVYTERVAGACA